MANQANIERHKWEKGRSGNPAGKPKGTKHISSWIRELLEDDSFEHKLKDGSLVKTAPVKAIINTMIIKSLKGDIRAFDLLCKYGYGSKTVPNGEELPVSILVTTRNYEGG